MQDRYACDVGDFAKFSLLTALSGEDLRLGVVWYLNGTEEKNDDGQFTEYGFLRNCNHRLHSTLQDILNAGTRNLTAVERSDALPPDTRFFRAPLSSSAERPLWLHEAGKAVHDAAIVFLDPDNGMPPSIAAYQRNPPKYATPREVNYFIQRQQSVLIYQHQTRTGTFEEQLERHCTELRRFDVPDVWVFTFHRLSARAFIMVPAQRHARVLEKRARTFIQSAWGREGHFRLLLHQAESDLRIGDDTGPPRAANGETESKGTTVPGYVNRNGQTVIRATGLRGTDHGQRVYVLRCGSCAREYGSNGSDNHQRRCPSCQQGKPGLSML